MECNKPGFNHHHRTDSSKNTTTKIINQQQTNIQQLTTITTIVKYKNAKNQIEVFFSPPCTIALPLFLPYVLYR